MTPEQIAQQISFAVQGLQIAFIQIGNVLEQKNIISKIELAESFESTARLLPDDLGSRDLSQKVLNGIAAGLRDADVPTVKLVH